MPNIHGGVVFLFSGNYKIPEICQSVNQTGIGKGSGVNSYQVDFHQLTILDSTLRKYLGYFSIT